MYSNNTSCCCQGPEALSATSKYFNVVDYITFMLQGRCGYIPRLVSPPADWTVPAALTVATAAVELATTKATSKLQRMRLIAFCSLRGL
jgi:hypothetical protein